MHDSISDAQTQLGDQERQYKFQINELDTVHRSLQKTLEDLQNDLQSARDSFNSTQEKLSQREAEVAGLEAENLRLRAEGSDSESMNLLKRSLSDQVSHIKNLESGNKEQNVELRHLRKVQRNVEVVEEQKKSLENQLLLMKGIEAELGNVQIQKQALEDERRQWSSLLQTGDQELDSPEAIVKALLQEQIEKANLVDKLGTIDAQLLERDEMIRTLETERGNFREEVDKLRAAAGGGAATGGMAAGVKSRLERQRALLVKEVEYLRAQLQTYDTEEVTMNADNSRFDEQKSRQVAEQQALIDEYKNELKKAHEEADSRQEKSPPKQQEEEPRGVKRHLSPTEDEAEGERLAVLVRKNRTLLESLSKAEQSATLMNRELEATKTQLKSLQSRSRTRILELRDNPTTQTENLKFSTITTLKEENQALLAQLHNQHPNIKVVPLSTLESMKLDIQDMQRTVSDKEKRMRRLKEIWTAKSSEFREAVASLLGFKLDFLPNGRVRVTSMFHLSPAYRHGEPGASSAAAGSMGNDEENSIIFDGEKGTMKISGGPNSLFALEIKHLIKFWVEERKDIPCFLAAMTLEFYDKTTRSMRV